MRAEADVYFPGSTIVIVEPVDLKWHNSDLAYDVNNDTQVSPLDALVVINWIAIASGGGNPRPETIELQFAEPQFLMWTKHYATSSTHLGCDFGVAWTARQCSATTSCWRSERSLTAG